MLKIVLMGDNHGDRDSFMKILEDNPCADYYLHVGDSGMSQEELEPFVSVKGNNDWQYEFPKHKILEIGKHRIFMLHGENYAWARNLLTEKAKQEDCDTVFFGHVHLFCDELENGIRMISPGSSFYNRDMSNPSYARVYIEDDGKIIVERIDL